MSEVIEGTKGVNEMEQSSFPKCCKCNIGSLVPLSDFGQGATMQYKAWCCTNPECGFNLKMQAGQIRMNDQIIKMPVKP